MRRGLLAGLLWLMAGAVAAQQPPTYPPQFFPGMAATGAVPHVAANAALAAAATATYPQGVWRDHYATGGTADGPLFFQPQAGTCAANSLVNDGGNCVDGPDGNSWKALHQNNVLNVKEFGALGNNSTDDTAAIQAAVNAAATGPNIAQDYIVVPAGNYCFKTSGGVTNSTQNLTFQAQGNVIWKSCGNTDTTILTLNARGTAILGSFAIQGLNSPTTTQPAFVLGSSCIECVVGDRVVAQYGTYPLQNAAPDAKIWLRASNGYGSAVAYNSGNAFWLRNKFDQSYPEGAPPAAPYTLTAWTANHTYHATDLVTIGSPSWILQETAGSCTSGSGSAPAVAAYGTPITDNSCSWLLVSPYTYYALQIDTGSTVNFVDKLDATGSYTCSVALTKTGASAPQMTTLRDINAGQPLSAGVCANFGSGLTIQGGLATNCVLVGCKGVQIASGFGAQAYIGAGFLAFGNRIDVSIEGGMGILVSGASLHGATSECVDVAANVNDFVISSNDLTNSGTWGSCTVPVKVESGTSTRYSITNNATSGIAVVDGGSATGKDVHGNN